MIGVFPATAILHHAIFHRPTCMLNNFGPEYDWETVSKWLVGDLSLWCAIVAMFGLFMAGRLWPLIRLFAAPLFVAFLPLCIWIWDIPFSGRIVCMTWHDLRTETFPYFAIKTKYLYVLGAIVHAGFAGWLVARERKQRRNSP